jgi:UDP-N-acetylglucosamine acyltransferase
VAVTIHSTAHVDPNALLADQVDIGPFAVIGPRFSLAKGVKIHSHVSISGHTKVGARTEIYPHAVIGCPPQDLKYQGGDTRLEIGEGNLIREFCTMNPGTELGGGLTKVGDKNLFMAYSHIAHDCMIGSRIIIANGTQLAGHVHVEDDAYISGLVAIHQFVTIGRCAFVAGKAGVTIDVPPFCLAQGSPTRILKLNEVGLRRQGFSAETIEHLKDAFRILYRGKGSRTRLLENVSEDMLNTCPEVREFVEFVKRAKVEGIKGRYLESKRHQVPPEELAKLMQRGDEDEA